MKICVEIVIEALGFIGRPKVVFISMGVAIVMQGVRISKTNLGCIPQPMRCIRNGVKGVECSLFLVLTLNSSFSPSTFL